MSDLLLKTFDNEPKESVQDLHVGDSVTIHLRINVGERNERVQVVRGTIIRQRNSGNNRNFTVRRIAANGIGVERTFLLNSPRMRLCANQICTFCVIAAVNLLVCGKNATTSIAL